MKIIPKKVVQTSSGLIEYSKACDGAPAIVLINGGSGPIEGWYKIFHELANETTVLAYNRLGIGKSNKPSSPQHGNAIINTLRELLNEVQINPPYIIVGHSLDLKLNQMQSSFIQKLNKIAGVFDSL